MPQRKYTALYKRDLKPGKSDAEQQEYWLHSHSEFDPKGNLTEQTVYDNHGAVLERVVKEYDTNGLLIHEQFFLDNNDPSDEKTYERDENGMLIREIKHYLDGSYDTITYFYDSSNRITRTVTMNDEGEAEQEMINEYRDDFLVRSRVTDGEGNLLQINEFVFHEQDNSVGHKRIDNESGDESHILTHYNSNGRKQSEIFYDEEGHMIGQTLYEEDEQGRLTKISEEGIKNSFTNFVYDENGNAVLQQEYDGAGNLVTSVKRKFDSNNNLIYSNVVIEGQGRNLPQHYEVRLEYAFYDEDAP